MVDHRDVTLQAVKQRYADDDCCKVSEIEVNTFDVLVTIWHLPISLFNKPIITSNYKVRVLKLILLW